VIADGADVTVYNADDKVPAVLQYGTYHDAFEVTGKAAAAAAAAGNPDQLADLFQDDLMDSSQRLASAIAAAMYTGTGAANHIHGLMATAGPLSATGTYAGIARGTYSQWGSNVIAAAGAPLTLALMRQMRRTIYTASGEKPDVIICDPEMHEVYGALMGTERRYVDNVRVRGQEIKLDGGYQVLEFDGIPVIEDVQATAKAMMFLNTRFLYLSQLPDPTKAFTQPMAMNNIPLVGTTEEQYGIGNTKLTARIIPLAKLGDAYKFQLISYPALVSRRCNVHGVISGLA
jgi:hypothetical protein